MTAIRCQTRSTRLQQHSLRQWSVITSSKVLKLQIDICTHIPICGHLLFPAARSVRIVGSSSSKYLPSSRRRRTAEQQFTYTLIIAAQSLDTGTLSVAHLLQLRDRLSTADCGRGEEPLRTMIVSDRRRLAREWDGHLWGRRLRNGYRSVDCQLTARGCFRTKSVCWWADVKRDRYSYRRDNVLKLIPLTPAGVMIVIM